MAAESLTRYTESLAGIREDIQAAVLQEGEPRQAVLNLIGEVIGSGTAMSVDEIKAELAKDRRYQDVVANGYTPTDAELTELRAQAYEVRGNQMMGEERV